MDRRQALKKLGVGTAVAVGTPLVLDTFNVASAASATTHLLLSYTVIDIDPSPLGRNDVVDITVTNASEFSGGTLSWSGAPAGLTMTVRDAAGTSVRLDPGVLTLPSSFTLTVTYPSPSLRYQVTVSISLGALGVILSASVSQDNPPV